jgi:signal transduction histidine kinase
MEAKRGRFDGLLHLVFTLLALIVPVEVGYEVGDQFRTPAIDFTIDRQSGVIREVTQKSSANTSGFMPGDVILAVNGVPYSQWNSLSLGVSMLEIQRGEQRLSLELPIFPLIKYNLPSLASAVVVALTYWSLSVWLLLQRFNRREVRIIFVASQALAIAMLAPMANLNARLNFWPIDVSVVGLYLSAPLTLHMYLSFPVWLGTQRRRQWGMGVLYGLAIIAIAGWLTRSFWGRQFGSLYTVLVYLAAIGVLGYVYIRRAAPDARRRLRLIVLGTLFGSLPAVLFYLAPDILGRPHILPLWLVGPFTIVIPVSFLFAILRQHLFGIDRLLNRTLVYAILSLGIFLLYLGPLLWLYRNLPDDWLLQTIVAASLTLLVGLGFNGTRERVQRWVDRFFYGGWYDYPRVVETISDSLARCLERRQLEDVLTQKIPTLMQLSRSRLLFDDLLDDLSMKPGSDELPLPLSFQGDVQAVWIVGPRRDGEAFSSSDQRILNTVARQAETALSNVLLVETLRRQLDEIRASRTALVQAQHQLLRTREDERARLARDLHDGPLQALVGLNLQLGLLQASSGSTDEALTEMRTEVQSLLSDLRQVCVELRPPMLDMFGLGAALRGLVEEWSGKNDITVLLDLPPNPALQALPGEVAVHLYRVAQEALSNIARHARARQVNLSLTWEDGFLMLTLEDDGRGFTLPSSAQELTAQGHFGLAGMQERVELIGGQLALESVPGGGATVRVTWMQTPR